MRKRLQASRGTRKLQEGTENKGSRVGKCPGDPNFNPGVPKLAEKLVREKCPKCHGGEVSLST